ncbi:MAG: hypothetical protein DSM106950_33245 [Stigonema ocellatum SAG 48.90 = DSM 106950]|nr:hypothetical protein [Stigonema ocellatum SAG 48.90 = DSM 106950]
MSDRQFSLEPLKTTFRFTISKNIATFSPSTRSSLLAEILKEYISLAIAISTKKSRFEFIIAPILFELKKELLDHISLFSGRK